MLAARCAASASGMAWRRGAARTAVLLGGGIGDYLHYIVRWDSLVAELGASDIVIFVESTVPDTVVSLFRAAFPEHEVRYLPGALHWVRSHPLIDIGSRYDRLHRPAYQFVREQGFGKIVDWFLPLACIRRPVSLSRLHALLRGGELEPVDVVVALRDKGFLWWPTQQHCQLIARFAQARGWSTAFIGTPSERPAWDVNFSVMPDVLAALRLSAAAKLFIGTDTGFGTIRQLLDLPNLCCINEYWWRDVMLPFGYVDARARLRLRRSVACDAREFTSKLARMFGADRGAGTRGRPGDARVA